MGMSLEAKAKVLRDSFPGIEGIKVKGSVISLGNAAEGGMIKGLPAADYYPDFGVGSAPWVNPRLESKLEKLGLYAEWYDPGTLEAGTL